MLVYRIDFELRPIVVPGGRTETIQEVVARAQAIFPGSELVGMTETESLGASVTMRAVVESRHGDLAAERAQSLREHHEVRSVFVVRMAEAPTAEPPDVRAPKANTPNP